MKKVMITPDYWIKRKNAQGKYIIKVNGSIQNFDKKA